MVKEHDRIVLTEPIPVEGLEVGDVGTVVHVYADGKAFESEFTRARPTKSNMIVLLLGPLTVCNRSTVAGATTILDRLAARNRDSE